MLAAMVLAALLAEPVLRATSAPAVTVLLIGMMLAYSVVSKLGNQRTTHELEVLRGRHSTSASTWCGLS
jgi:hypothetical protein